MAAARDMTPTVDLTRHLGAGPVRSRRPVYVDLLPPCNVACPAGEDIQAWLGLAQAGKFREAWEALIRDNPMPAVHGRVCYHPCETSCNRKELDSAVGIHAVERFLGDLAASENWPMPAGAPPTGKRVLIVGAGPSGLSAAYHLTRFGHQVEIHEAGPLPGGMLHFGIPAYRLPREDLMKEIGRIESMGVRIVLNHKVDDVLAEQEAGRFDAVFIAIGAHLSKHVDIPARDAVKVLDAVSMLHDVETGDAPLARPSRRRLRRRQHRHGRRAHCAPPRRRRSDDRLPARPGAHARPRIRGGRGAGGRRQDQVADLDQGDRRRRSDRRDDADRRERAGAADRAIRNAAGRRRRPRRSARTPTAGSCARSPKSCIRPTARWSSVPT